MWRYEDSEIEEKLTITEDKEWPKLENIVPTQSARSKLRTIRSQKYLHSLDIIKRDLHVKTATLVALLTLPLLLIRGPSWNTDMMIN